MFRRCLDARGLQALNTLVTRLSCGVGVCKPTLPVPPATIDDSLVSYNEPIYRCLTEEPDPKVRQSPVQGECEHLRKFTRNSESDLDYDAIRQHLDRGILDPWPWTLQTSDLYPR